MHYVAGAEACQTQAAQSVGKGCVTLIRWTKKQNSFFLTAEMYKVIMRQERKKRTTPFDAFLYTELVKGFFVLSWD